MPFGDGTGPKGIGPITGRAAGYCTSFAGPGFANPIHRGGISWPYRYSRAGEYRGFPPYVGYGRAYYSGAYGLPPQVPV